MNGQGSTARTSGAPAPFRSKTPFGPTLSTYVTTNQTFFDFSSSRPAQIGDKHLPRVISSVYRLKSLPQNAGPTYHVAGNKATTREGTFQNFGQKILTTRNRTTFQNANRSKGNGKSQLENGNKATSSVGVPLRDVRPCGRDVVEEGFVPGDDENEVQKKTGCPLDTFDFSQCVGGKTVPAPYGQSKESTAEWCCGGDLSLTPPVSSSAASEDNGTPGFVKNLMDGKASTQGYTLPATNVMGAFVGASSTPGGTEQATNLGRLVWLSGQKTAYDNQSNIRGRPPFQSQLNPVIFTNSNADYYTQGF